MSLSLLHIIYLCIFLSAYKEYILTNFDLWVSNDTHTHKRTAEQKTGKFKQQHIKNIIKHEMYKHKIPDRLTYETSP